MIEPYYHSHFLVPPQSAKGHQNTTVDYSTEEKHSPDTFVSSRADRAICASVPHHQVLSRISVNAPVLMNNIQFVPATSRRTA
jgi:hypothetical protein